MKRNNCSCVVVVVTLCSLLFLSSCSIAAKTSENHEHRQLLQDYDLPYALAFYFNDPTLPEGTCANELNTIHDAVYPVFKTDITTDSILDVTDVNRLEEYYESDSYATNDQILNRNLRQNDLQRNQHRQLQTWCYPLCDEKPILWLINAGCKAECNLRRNRELMTLSSESIAFDASQDIYYEKYGTSTEILYGQGDLSASTFYQKVRDLISRTNPCRSILLQMKYKRVPLVVNLP
jgi:hypothetical protein